MTSLIKMQGISKSYRGAAALDGVDFELHRDEIHALLGENGAGKSTLTKIIAGVVQQSAGRLMIEGQEVAFANPAEALRAGIAMVFQETSLIPSMSVAQNLYLGNERFFNRLRGIYISAQQFLQSLNFNVDPWAMVASLGAAKKQMVEIARAVLQDAKVIIFDEPTATLTPEEKHHFFSLVQRLKARGVSVVFITHALEEALQISDRNTILRDGRLVATDKTAAFDRRTIIRHMVGRELSSELYERKQSTGRKPGPKIISVENLSMGSLVRNNSFSIYEGQICGIFGLIGSGRTETAKVIAGVQKRNYLHGGEIKLFNRSVRYLVPRPAVKDGIAYVTEDRKIEGFFETMSIADNIHLGLMGCGKDGSVVFRPSEVRRLAETWVKRLNVKAINSNARVVELSGGNQQKVVIASSLVQQPKVVIFDEPNSWSGCWRDRRDPPDHQRFG